MGHKISALGMGTKGWYTHMLQNSKQKPFNAKILIYIYIYIGSNREMYVQLQ